MVFNQINLKKNIIYTFIFVEAHIVYKLPLLILHKELHLKLKPQFSIPISELIYWYLVIYFIEWFKIFEHNFSQNSLARWTSEEKDVLIF